MKTEMVAGAVTGSISVGDKGEAYPAPAGDTRPAIPGPRPLPLLDWIGNTLPILRDPVVQMLELQKAYGDIVSLGRRKTAPILVFSPEYNHQLLTNPDVFYSLDVNSEQSAIQMPQNTAASRLLSGVAGMNGAKHKQHRRLLMPGFHKKRVEALCDTIAARTEKFLSRWQPGQQINLPHEMVELSLDFAITGLVGLDPEREGHRVHNLLQRWGKSGLSAQVWLLPFDLPGLPYRRFLRLSEQLEAEFLEVIARKRESSIDDGDALSILLNAKDEVGDKLTDAELLGHLTTLFTAGHETTASAMTWNLFLLTQHPHAMEAVMEEIDSKLGISPPTLEKLRDMPVMESAIKEGLRLFPPGIWMLRTSVEPFEIGPYKLPAGTQLVYSPAITHRRPDIYPQPNRYMPERWQSIEPSTYEFLPFGGGPRRCLGATFAMLELQVALPIILQRYRLSVPDNTRVDRSGTILSFPRKLPVVLHEQDRRFTQTRGLRGNIHQLVDF